MTCIQFNQLLVLLLILRIQSNKLLVHRVQLLVCALQFLVRNVGLLIERIQFLIRHLQGMAGRLEVVFCAAQFVLKYFELLTKRTIHDFSLIAGSIFRQLNHWHRPRIGQFDQIHLGVSFGLLKWLETYIYNDCFIALLTTHVLQRAALLVVPYLVKERIDRQA